MFLFQRYSLVALVALLFLSTVASQDDAQFPCGSILCDNTPDTICVLNSATGAFPTPSCQTQGAVCSQSLQVKCQDPSIYKSPPVGFNSTLTAPEICGNQGACNPPSDPAPVPAPDDADDTSGSVRKGIVVVGLAMAAMFL